MASSALRKKLNNKRSISKPNPRPSSSPPPPPMAPGPSPPNYRKISLIFSAFLIFCVVLTLAVSSNFWTNPNSVSHSASPAVYSVEIVNEFHHDPQAYTQGLLYAEKDTLFESTGLYGQSSLRKVALQTGKVEVIQSMDDSYFGEGLTLIDERLFQVTWLTKTGFIYDRYNFSKFSKFTHQMKDGWGLATDGKVMFGSDGSSTLYKIDLQTLKVIDEQIVKFNGYEVHNLNELEFIKGEVWANVYMTDCIARISHEDGNLLGWILLQSLREELIRKGYSGFEVLNGIAWDSQKNRIFVTGKLWPLLFEIKLHPIKKHFGSGVLEHLCMRGPINFGRP